MWLLFMRQFMHLVTCRRKGFLLTTSYLVTPYTFCFVTLLVYMGEVRKLMAVSITELMVVRSNHTSSNQSLKSSLRAILNSWILSYTIRYFTMLTVIISERWGSLAAVNRSSSCLRGNRILSLKFLLLCLTLLFSLKFDFCSKISDEVIFTPCKFTL